METGSKSIISAAILVIGDEVLSGRTADVNIHHIARVLTSIGVDLCEARVVQDNEAEIIAAVNALRARYTYVFTTGGIGPTHDDITAEAIAKAFGIELELREDALNMLRSQYGPHAELNEARKRMARVPIGATLVRNTVSGAPGFQIGNVFVMAGVPAIMQAMLEDVVPRLKTGTPVISKTVAAQIGESTIARPLAEIQRDNPEVSIGSYPSFGPGGPRCALVVRGRNGDLVEKVTAKVEGIVRSAGGNPSRIT